LQLVAYRVVQDALPNALKHGGRGEAARVDVRVSRRSMEVEVDHERGTPSIRPYGAVPTQGRGLLGMRERWLPTVVILACASGDGLRCVRSSFLTDAKAVGEYRSSVMAEVAAAS